MITVTLYLMTEKGFRVLESIDKYISLVNFNIIIGKDDNLQNDFSKEIEEFCLIKNLKHCRRELIDNSFKNSDYSMAISWRWIIDVENLIVFHDSLLPKYRGFAPLVNALVNGEEELGVSAIFASENYDEGPIIKQSSIKVKYPIKINEVIKEISHLYIHLFENVIEQIIKEGILKAVKQNEELATYSLWLDDEDYFLDWKLSSEKLKRKIDACSYPYKYASCYINNNLIRITEAEITKDVLIENRKVGKVIFVKNGYPYVVCGKGLLIVKSGFYDESGEPLLPLKKFRTRFL